MKLRDKVAIVTGGGQGIGRAIAETFAREGASVVLAGRRLEKLRQVQEAIAAAGGAALAVAADVGDEADDRRLIAETLRAFGRLHILVNNAGIFFTGAITDTAVEDWDRLFAVNVRGVYLLSRLALPEIERSGGGSIINVSSTLGQQVIPACAAYCASKAALDMITESMALDYAAKGIRVNAVSPGVVDTPLHSARQGADPAGWERQVAAMHPLGRVGQPYDVTAAVLYLVSDEASWVTGANLAVDGGIHLT